MNIAILILAAGQSSRMNQPKQLLPLGNTTLLGTCIQNAIQSEVDATYVVLGAHAELLQDEVANFPVQVIMNSNFENGLSSSIVAGIKHLLEFDAVLITLADQPKVDATYLNLLISEFKKQDNCVIASDYKGTYGVPAVFPKRYFTELLKLKTDKGAKSLLNSEDVKVKTINSFANLVDIDTPEDYQKLIKKNK